MAATELQWMSGVQRVLSNATKMPDFLIRADNERIFATDYMEKKAAARRGIFKSQIESRLGLIG